MHALKATRAEPRQQLIYDALGIHCTINRSEHDPNFIESIKEFVADWASGLQRLT